jgi:hypothetical protein
VLPQIMKLMQFRQGRIRQIFANCPPGIYTCESKIRARISY